MINKQKHIPISPGYLLEITDTRISLEGCISTYHNDYFDSYRTIKQEEETEKEKIARIAKEKMYASWKTYNDRTTTIKDVKQICKPRHRVNYSGKRN